MAPTLSCDNEYIITALLVAKWRRECHSLWGFVQEFWNEVPGTGKLVTNWHLEFLCNELQAIAERVFNGEPVLHDLIINVSPGCSKSSICSILFPAWLWSRMPSCRILSASHADDLVMDLANKSRWVIKSEKYRATFPQIEFREDQDSKGYYANTAGGDRKTCTVGGKSPVGFHGSFLICDDILDPKRATSEADTKTAKEFVTDILPSRKIDKAITPTILIMQRLRVGDPTDVMLEESRKEGAIPVRHICLPAELDDNIQPPELAAKYVDGLMDPSRLSRTVLNAFRSHGTLYYATQFLQRPFRKGGGLFKPTYFNHRVKAAPYAAKRVRFWDRAATHDAGCNTAGVLMARSEEGNLYVEHVELGKWEPDERDQRIVATAHRDRTRYGPHNEPTIYIEHEPGSSGIDAYKATARKLAGFKVRPDRPTGSKETRAEPFSSECASGNVYIVEDGCNTWDIQGYIDELCAFPSGMLRDQVDASSGGANLLLGKTPPLAANVFRSVKIGPTNGKKPPLRLIVCCRDDLPEIAIETQPAIFVSLFTPGNPNGEAPACGLSNRLDTVILKFADIDPADYQDRWQTEQVNGVAIAEAVMDRLQGKRLWSSLLRKRTVQPEIIVIQGEGEEDRRPLSLACGVSDAMSLPRSVVIQWRDRDATFSGQPPNKHVWSMTKASRNMVVS